jgi:hypothetical protein
MMCGAARVTFGVIPAEAGTHAPIVVRSDTCVGVRLRGHDVVAEGAP